MGKAELKVAIDEALLAQAQASGLDIAQVVEEALRFALPPAGLSETDAPTRPTAPLLSDEEKARRWAEENAEAIKANRERIEEFGIFGEDLRTW